MRLTSQIVITAFAAVTMLHAAADPPMLRPVDEGSSAADFLAFRVGLLETLARRDVPALLDVVHPKIRNTFGGEDGVDAFTRIWRLEQPDSELWLELRTLLTLGGSLSSPDVFVAPYVFSRWPDRMDAFDHVALVGRSVHIRSAPNTSAGVITTMSFSILRLGGDGGYPQRPWTSVVLPDGRAGFVASELVRSPIDYRAYFVRSTGRWQMTALIAGD